MCIRQHEMMWQKLPKSSPLWCQYSSSYAQFPGHRGDEACDAGRTAGRRVVGAADAVVLDGLGAEKGNGRGK